MERDEAGGRGVECTFRNKVFCGIAKGIIFFTAIPSSFTEHILTVALEMQKSSLESLVMNKRLGYPCSKTVGTRHFIIQ